MGCFRFNKMGIRLVDWAYRTFRNSF